MGGHYCLALFGEAGHEVDEIVVGEVAADGVVGVGGDLFEKGLVPVDFLGQVFAAGEKHRLVNKKI